MLSDEQIDKSLLADFAKGVNYLMYPVGFYQDANDG
jgi:hypothetical protein